MLRGKYWRAPSGPWDRDVTCFRDAYQVALLSFLGFLGFRRGSVHRIWKEMLQMLES